MTPPDLATWLYAEQYHPETEEVLRARARAEELGCVPVSPGVGATLRFLTAATGAQSVIEVGTGSGVSGLYLLDGMHPNGTLTSIDVDLERQRAAREAFTEAQVAPNRYRLITGNGLDVLARLRENAYDIVFLDADKATPDAYLAQTVRLLRRGGTLAVDNVLWKGKVADPTKRDGETSALRDIGRLVRSEGRLVSTLVATGDGLLLATKR